MPLVLPKPRLRPLERVAQARISDHRVFSVEESTFRRADGKTQGPFFTFACPDWCNVIAVTPERELLLVWQYRQGTLALTLELPGGVIDPGESPRDAAARELREETGYEAASYRPLLRLHPNPALQGNVCHSFVAEAARPAGEPRFDEHEECELVRVPLDDALALVQDGHVTHALSVAAIQAFLLEG